MLASRLDRSGSDIVLVVDDVPENLSLLHDALEESGHTVLVATGGESALQCARQALPDVILLDALMPGMDGFEVARRLKADYATQHIPIIFMTGLTDTEHVVAGFAAGGADYVTKPIRPPEVLARIAAHVGHARETHQARDALDASDQATLAIDPDSRRILWQTARARALIAAYFPGEHDIPSRLQTWLDDAQEAVRKGMEALPLHLARGTQGTQRLRLRMQARTGDRSGSEWLVVLQEESDAHLIEELIRAFRLTQREAEVLYWVIKGKTTRDVGEILSLSPRTVNKHLEHVFEKLGVETRTAAVATALARVRALMPPRVD